jgi:nitrite reductase/ring-hydroxylating ferredoxin subunit
MVTKEEETVTTALDVVEDQNSNANPEAKPEITDDNCAKPAEPVLIIEEEEVEASIVVADHDKDRIVVTLPNGTRYETDRYCPHAGADLSQHGDISLDEYGPEIGPILVCSIHYWEFLLDKEGNSGNGWATIDACKLQGKACPVEENGKLAW